MGGFNLPPGVTTGMINALFEEGPCECCGNPVDTCICPECPRCGASGDPGCYNVHGLALNKAQLTGRVKLQIARLQDRISDEQQYLAWLDEQPADYSQTLEEVGAELLRKERR